GPPAEQDESLLGGGDAVDGISAGFQGDAKGLQLGFFVVDDQQGDGLLQGHACSDPAERPGRLAKASRNCASLGGLLSTRSTFGGLSASARMRCPQPVRRITGVAGDFSLTAAATLRPST